MIDLMICAGTGAKGFTTEKKENLTFQRDFLAPRQVRIFLFENQSN